MTKNVDNMTEMTQIQEQLIPKNDNITTKIDNDINTKTNGHSQKVSIVKVSGNGKSYLSYNNPLISEQISKIQMDFNTTLK